MDNNYYIQKGSDTYKDIASEWGIYVKQTSGLNLLPEVKEPFKRSWPDQQGDDVYSPTTTFFETKKVKITFYLTKTTKEEVKSKLKNFRDYVADGGSINYFDTYKKEGFRGYYVKNSIEGESYRGYGSNIEFDMEFECPNGICWGFDNSGQSSIFVEITKGMADFYFSNGDYILNQSESFTKSQAYGFVIVCPTVLGGVFIEPRLSKVIGIGSKVIGIGSKVIGI